ncbi:MAG: transglutaminase family protein [Streptosporangiaceae bacterium]
MSWRIGIVHTTRVSYSGTARASYNEARMTPPAMPRQMVLATRVQTGVNAPIWTYRDYWGTTVSCFDIQEPHHELLVQATATVQTTAPQPAKPPLAWPDLREQAASSYVLEFLGETSRTTLDPQAAAEVTGWVTGAEPDEAAREIVKLVHGRVSYQPGSTGVQTSAHEAWAARSGVCQDMAHISVALLRAAGLPARYVSGYLHPDPKAEPGHTVAGQSHAWAEYWTGEWVPVDPTSLAPVGERHVILGRGRDYADVSPLRGIYSGAPSVAMEVTVEVTRLA